MINFGINKSGFFAVLALSAGIFSGVVSAAEPVGDWKLSSGKITVRINYCGGQNLCATIVGMAQPLTKSGQPKTDKDNPDPALRSRKIIGLQVVSGMVPDGENRWRGKIYNADDGATYKATAEVNGNELVIKACTLGGLACKKKRFARIN